MRFGVRPEGPNRTRSGFGVRKNRLPNRTAPDRGNPTDNALSTNLESDHLFEQFNVSAQELDATIENDYRREEVAASASKSPSSNTFGHSL
jgi:hypothetical protein